MGLSATVEIEGSSPHKIQVKSLITQHNSSLPAYAPFNSQNSEKLPAQFVLKLSQPFPILSTSIQQMIHEMNEPTTIKDFLSTVMSNSKESIVSLIARQELDLNKGPFCRSVDTFKVTDSDLCDLKKHVYSIKLLDESHTYHILDNYLEGPESNKHYGVYLNKIPFTHPTSIPIILRVLRQQALFNFVIGSCIRRNKLCGNSHPADENQSKVSLEANIFDVIPVSLNNLCVSFEHPSKESLATVEIDFRDLSCQLYALDKESVCSDEYATKVLQKCWSIPITLRSVLKKCNERRLALLEDSNRRRERELQELLTNNSSTQPELQFKSHLKDNMLQSKFNNLSEKSNSRDLNSIAEFLSSKINNASTSDNSEQVNATADNASNRSNLLKKFSCKPKVKQSASTKNQSGGNKILSLMLKRQNSSPSIEDPNLKGPTTKKARTKNPPGIDSAGLKGTTTSLTTTKLISSEVANQLNARMTSIKQTKQGSAGNNPNISLSLIRSPSKTQSAIPSSSNAPLAVGLSLTSNSATSSSKQFDPSLLNSSNSVNNIKTKSNGPNSTIMNNLSAMGKPRKSSIGAVLDKLVGGVTPEQQSNLLANHLLMDGEATGKILEGSKLGQAGNKFKSRQPGDQFAIKQSSLGGGLKLTVTKTKPSSNASASGSASAATLTQNATASAQSPSISSSASTSSSSSTTTSNSGSNSAKSDANKILEMGSSAPIRYTIPKISKAQQASQSSAGQANSTENSNSNDSNSQGDDSSNPSSSGNLSSMPSSTTANKRTTSNPFNRTNSSNRNPVSSSTHPPIRTTSNPLAVANNRPSSTSNNESHLLNRISSTNQQANVQRQHLSNRTLNLTPQMPQMHQPIQQQVSNQQQQQQQMQVLQRLMNPNILTPHQSLPGQSALSQSQSMFSMPMSLQPGSFPSKADLNLIAASQVALLNQQQQLQQLQMQQQQQQSQPLLSRPLQQQQSRVSSSSDEADPALPGQISQSALPSSTPSSPTECGQAETVEPPPLIPIDSLDEAQPASPDNEPDDSSDRLSIVDMNDNVADSASLVGTPKPSSVSSPIETHDSSQAASSSTTAVAVPSRCNNADSVTIPTSPPTVQAVSNSLSGTLPNESNTTGEAFPANELAAAAPSVATCESGVTSQSPQSTTVPTATTTD